MPNITEQLRKKMENDLRETLIEELEGCRTDLKNEIAAIVRADVLCPEDLIAELHREIDKDIDGKLAKIDETIKIVLDKADKKAIAAAMEQWEGD